MFNRIFYHIYIDMANIYLQADNKCASLQYFQKARNYTDKKDEIIYIEERITSILDDMFSRNFC